MIFQASPPPAPAPIHPPPNPSVNILIAFAKLAHYVSSTIVFFVIIGGIALCLHLLILCLKPVWIQLLAFLRRFEFFDRAFRAITEWKSRKVLRKVMKDLPPVVKYENRGGTTDDGSSCLGCAICLDDFEDGELCQVLPLCDHAFHSACIKPWLVNNQNCPNCRTPIKGKS